MTGKARRIATPAVALVVTCGVLAAASGASATITFPLNGWAVYGELTAKKLNEPVVLPKGSTLSGEASLTRVTETENEGTIKAKLTVPPFTTHLKLGGLGGIVPTTLNVKLEEVGESTGTISPAPFEECAQTRFGFSCTTIAVTSHSELYLSSPNVAGIEAPANCKTKSPIELPLKLKETFGELLSESHFTGTSTIPEFECEGLLGVAEGLLFTTALSGPENPYKIGLAPHEPTPPEVEISPASSVSQISARLHGSADPAGEPITDCHFEWGKSPTYGTSVPCVTGRRAALVFEADRRSAFVTGLSENTTYHYRIVATNSLGTSHSADHTFTTPGPPTAAEYGHCVAQKGGEYIDASCSSKSKKAKKGKFEWRPGPSATCAPQEKGEYTDAACTAKSKHKHKGGFEKSAGPKFSSSSGSVTLESSAGKVTCSGGTGAGEITGVYAGVERITFTGCEMAGKKCTSEGANATPSGTPGSITTNLLDTRLLGPVEGQFGEPEVWTELTSGEHQPYIAEFGCEGPLLRITGHASGVREGDVGTPSAASTTTFTAEKGEQQLLSELSTNGGSSWGAAAPSTLAVVLSNTAELSTAEIKP
jgi:hypothetical protein